MPLWENIIGCSAGHELAKASPSDTSLKVDYSGQYKRFDFARPSALGLPIPSDEELEALVKKLCITL